MSLVSYAKDQDLDHPANLLILEVMRIIDAGQGVSLDHLNHDAVPFLWIGRNLLQEGNLLCLGLSIHLAEPLMDENLTGEDLDHNHPTDHTLITPLPARHGRTASPARHGQSPSPSRCPRSPSPSRCPRSPSPARHRRSPSPARLCRRSLTTSQGRSPSPYGLSSPSSAQCGSSSSRLPLESPREGHRLQERSSLMTHRPSSMMSLQPDLRNQKEIQNKVSGLSSSPEKSPIVPELPSKTKRRTASEDGSPYESSLGQRREQMTHNGCRSPQRKPGKFKSHQDSPETSKENEQAHKAREGSNDRSRSSHRISSCAPNLSKWKSSPGKLCYPERLAGS
ncbi:hypothetical protein SLA2020_393470 [Shorea laevis]